MVAATRALLVPAFALALAATGGVRMARTAPAAVHLIRVPGGGIQPQVAEQNGILHILYFSGRAEHGDLLYVRSRDYGVTFSVPVRVNTAPGSAIAVGTIRGAQLAVGLGGRVHVAWNGSDQAQPRGGGDQSPMLYTRLNDAGTAFEPERNLTTSAWGIDGGGALAADALGHVYVFWHAPLPGWNDEAHRRVWVAASTDDGKTFAREVVAFDREIGACGCCSMRASADAGGRLHVLFRSALQLVHRDMYLLTSTDQGRTFRGSQVATWTVGACVMSSASLVDTPQGTLAAWETEQQVYVGRVVPGPAAGGRGTAGPTDGVPAAVGAPGRGDNRKYPSLAVNARGETLFAWTEDTAWQRGGSVAWQVYDQDLRPAAAPGKAAGVPVWSLVAAFARPDGSFGLVY